ncbi:MAG: type II toxin-antitoxin system VapC family toxin [Planctomycetes bacterium]|nr:type II toxin-antitoxin system VapC family toxin [Planctomycetota bacterium]
MSALVVDAGVVAAAFFRQTHTPAARSLLTGGQALYAPDLIWTQTAAALWKRFSLHELTATEVKALMCDVLRLPLQVLPSVDLAEAALDLALQLGQSFHDCLYIAAALRTEGRLITANAHLVHALIDTPLAQRVTWIGTT